MRLRTERHAFRRVLWGGVPGVIRALILSSRCASSTRRLGLGLGTDSLSGSERVPAAWWSRTVLQTRATLPRAGTSSLPQTWASSQKGIPSPPSARQALSLPPFPPFSAHRWSGAQTESGSSPVDPSLSLCIPLSPAPNGTPLEATSTHNHALPPSKHSLS